MFGWIFKTMKLLCWVCWIAIYSFIFLCFNVFTIPLFLLAWLFCKLLKLKTPKVGRYSLMLYPKWNDSVVPMFITTLSQTRMKSRFLAADEYISPKKSNSVGASWLKPSRKIAHLRLSSPPYIMEAQRRQAR